MFSESGLDGRRGVEVQDRLTAKPAGETSSFNCKDTSSALKLSSCDG